MDSVFLHKRDVGRHRPTMNFFLGKIGPIALIHSLHNFSSFYCPVKLNSRFITYQPKMFTSDNSDFKKFIESSSYDTEQLSCDICKEVFVVAIIRARLVNGRFSAFQNFETTSVILLMRFRSGRSITFLPELRGSWESNRYLGRNLGMITIALFNHR